MKLIKKIFLIDDDYVFRFLMTHHCKKIIPDVRIFDFADGEGAIRQIKNELPDLIFLDLNMSMLDSWDFLTKLEKLNLVGEISIYIVTVSLNKLDWEKADEHPLVKGLLVKPLKENDIKQLLLDNRI